MTDCDGNPGLPNGDQAPRATGLPAPSPQVSAWSRFCKKCHYPLEGLSRNRCPECGLPFDPLNPRTYSRSPSAIDLPVAAATVWARLARLPKVAAAVGLAAMVLIRYAALHWTDFGWCFVLCVYPAWVGGEIWLGTRLVAGEGRTGWMFWLPVCVLLGFGLSAIDAWMLTILGVGAGVVVTLVCMRTEM